MAIEYTNLDESKEAPCARIESLSNLNQSVSINLEKDQDQENLIPLLPIKNFKRFLKSSNYLHLKQIEKQFAFSSDSCLPPRAEPNLLDFEQNNSIASTVSLRSNMQLDGIKPIKRLLSTANSVSLSRCHSLELRNSRSETNNNLKLNSSVPADLQSLESNLNLNDRDFMTESKKGGIELDANEEYVVVDADDIANCGSNLILSSSQNAIYFPIISSQDQDESTLKVAENQLVDTIDEKNQQNCSQINSNSLSKLEQTDELKSSNLDPKQQASIQQQQNTKNVFSFFMNKFKLKETNPTNQQLKTTPINLVLTNNQNQASKAKRVALNQLVLKQPILLNKNGQKIAHKKYIIAKCQCKHRQPTGTKNTTKVRHLPNCPFYYINLARLPHNQAPAHGSQKANLYHVPNLFQNSYRFPLHFRNVYYYKSLVNLNMKIMVLRPHGAGALTVNAPANVNNVSYSCPDLQLKQILIVKKNQAQSGNNQESKTSYPVLTIKDSKIAKRQLDMENLKSCSGAKVLNAGSILLLSNPVNRRDSINNKKSLDEKNQKLIIENKKEEDMKKLLNTNGKEEVKKSNFNDKIEEEDDEEEEEEDSDDDDSEDEEDCDNCFTRTKYGNTVYKYLYKPVVKPLKFIYYSIAENLRLFRVYKFCVFAFCNFILSFFYEAPFYFINSFMTENGSSSSQAGTVTVAVGIVSVFSSSKSKN